MRPEQISYGVKDFKRVRLENFYYVDKSQYIEKLESRANFLFFVRPRRFGKSMLCEMLRCYYDVAEKEKKYSEDPNRELFRLEEVDPATGEKIA